MQTIKCCVKDHYETVPHEGCPFYNEKQQKLNIPCIMTHAINHTETVNTVHPITKLKKIKI